MTREEAKRKVESLLFGSQNPNAQFNFNVLSRYNHGEHSPVSPMGMGNVNKNHCIVITYDVLVELKKIRKFTEKTDREVGYFLFGEELKSGTVLLNEIYSTYTGDSVTHTTYDSAALSNHVKDIENGKYNNGNTRIICQGHTHGKTYVSDNFSLGDLIAAVQFNELYSNFKKGQIETIQMMMPPCGDYDFYMYESNPNCEGFYKFPEVYVMHPNSSFELLPAYDKGNYIGKQRNI